MGVYYKKNIFKIFSTEVYKCVAMLGVEHYLINKYPTLFENFLV